MRDRDLYMLAAGALVAWWLLIRKGGDGPLDGARLAVTDGIAWYTGLNAEQEAILEGGTYASVERAKREGRWRSIW